MSTCFPPVRKRFQHCGNKLSVPFTIQQPNTQGSVPSRTCCQEQRTTLCLSPGFYMLMSLSWKTHMLVPADHSRLWGICLSEDINTHAGFSRWAGFRRCSILSLVCPFVSLALVFDGHERTSCLLLGILQPCNSPGCYLCVPSFRVHTP